MRYRDRIRVTHKIKKGTSRAKRQKLARMTRIAEGVCNRSDVRAMAAEVILDSLIHGQSAVKVTWDGEKAGAEAP